MAIRTICCICLFLTTLAGKGQTLADSIYDEIVSINKVYDSAFFLTFDVKMEYSSDTLWAGTDSADFVHTELRGTYTFNGNKALYKLDNIEYMQNDSFAIAVYKDEKFILVGKTSATATGSFLPMRTMLDSMMAHMKADYVYMITTSDSVWQISFTANDSNVVYESMVLEYEPESHHLITIKYRLKDDGLYDPLPDSYDVRRADLIFLFQNYRVEQVSESVFSEDKYLFFDGPGDIKPASAYKDYIIYKNYQ
ncbi:MAG TPA: hypothetical protein VK483_07635 [Chitinophagaceae bacterium]|nr:hypothetical protein [Chitinophagaceae bacterium]